MRILAIESSCDETAAAVVEDGRNVLSSVVASQVEEHRLYGGVVPEIASRGYIRAGTNRRTARRRKLRQGLVAFHRTAFNPNPPPSFAHSVELYF